MVETSSNEQFVAKQGVERQLVIDVWPSANHCLQFLKHLRRHIDEEHPAFTPNCCAQHVLIVCSSRIQQEIFGNVDSGISYKILQKLGKGSYGIVNLIQIKKSKVKIAVKKVHQEDFKEAEVYNWVRAQAKRKRRSPKDGLPTLYAVAYDGETVEFFMEFLQGWTIKRLSKVITKLNLEVSQNTMLLIFYNVCKALDQLHRRRIVHRDLSPNNIIVCNDLVRVVIIDFGLSDILTPDEDFVQGDDYVGNKYFLSPQAARGNEVDFKTDVWGAMMVCLCLLGDGTPILKQICPDKDDWRLLRKFIQQFRDDSSNENRQKLMAAIEEYKLEERILDVVHRALRCSHSSRPSVQQLLQITGPLVQGQSLNEQPELCAVRDFEHPANNTDLLEVVDRGDGDGGSLMDMNIEQVEAQMGDMMTEGNERRAILPATIWQLPDSRGEGLHAVTSDDEIAENKRNPQETADLGTDESKTEDLRSRGLIPVFVSEEAEMEGAVGGEELQQNLQKGEENDDYEDEGFLWIEIKKDEEGEESD